MKKIWIVTLYPDYFKAFKEQGVLGQAFNGRRGESIELEVIQLRDYALDKHNSVDDYPYGGGPGMVMKVDVLAACVESILRKSKKQGSLKECFHIVYPSPCGYSWKAQKAKNFARNHFTQTSTKDLIFICGRFEGVDQRFIDLYVDEQICIGDYVLTGGELATMAILDSSLRFVPGILGNKLSAETESFSQNQLEYAQYTRPAEFKGQKVPDILLSGHHKNIEIFQLQEARARTEKMRPDLL